MSRPFICNMITDMVRFKSNILLFIFYLSHLVLFSFSSFMVAVGGAGVPGEETEWGDVRRDGMIYHCE